MYQVLDSKTVLNTPWVTICQERVAVNGLETDYYTARRGDGVMVLAITPCVEVVMVREYQHGCRQTLLQLPRGGLKLHEPPGEAAWRELLEETGYTAPEFRCTGPVYVDPVWSKDKLYLFVAESAEWVAKPKHDDIELIEVELVDRRDAVRLARDGDILDPYSVALLLRSL